MKQASSKVGTPCYSTNSNSRAVINRVIPTGRHCVEAFHLNELISPPTKPVICVLFLTQCSGK